jgi:integrase
MKKWKATEGERPHTVTVYERKTGRNLYMRIWDPELEAVRKRSLKHRDKKMARRQARAEAVNLAEGCSDLMAGKITLAQVFALYLQHRSPRKKTDEERKTDERRAEMWARVLGAKTDPHRVTLRKWEEFIDARLSGLINARGEPVDQPEAIRTRTVESNLNWLKWVFNWAVKWQKKDGGYLMRENPVRGFDIPTEKNVRRPYASHDRYEKIRAVTDQVVTGSGRSHLSEVFDLAVETGRRINAICQLRYADLCLDDGTFGSIRWPADTDKMERETSAPLSQIARGAIDRVLRDRPGVGEAYLFPSPGDLAKPITRHLAAKWLRRAEKLAGVEPLQGSLWHAYRRKWATERKHLPDVDVANAGGWKTIDTLKLAYQHADADTMFKVVSEPRRIREA